ncbi:MAG: amidohydrolase, partial [Chitinophagaceae bacterium]
KYNYCYDVLIYPQHLTETLHFVSKFANQKFVIDHAAKPAIAKGEWKKWSEEITMLAQHPQVYCKLSGLFTEAKWNQWKQQDFYPYLDTLFETFGANRLMFGSDWPVINTAGNYNEWLQLLQQYMQQLPEKDISKIMGENAIHFYAL